MKCPICSKETKDNAKFCVQCGNKIPRCPSCNTVITEKRRFCMKDGAELPIELVALLPEPPEPPQPIQKQEHKIIVPPNVPVKRFCKQCGKVCPEGQAVCADCQAKTPKRRRKKKSILPIILIILLLMILLGVGAFAITMVMGVNPFVSGTPSNSAVENDDNSEDAKDEERDDSSNSKEQEADKDSDSDKEDAPEEVIDELADSAIELTEEHKYEIVASDISWSDANEAAVKAGGHLATITSLEEMNEISNLAEKSGLKYLWLGAVLTSSKMEWSDNSWLTGEEWTYENWYPGEPSKEDTDGTKEYYLCLWKAKYQEQDIGWTFNDQRNDIVKDFDECKGKVGYIIEYGDGYKQ